MRHFLKRAICLATLPWLAGLLVAGGSGNDLLPDIAMGIRTVKLESIVELPSIVMDITHAGDGSGRLFLVSPEGIIRIVKDGVLYPTPFLNDPAYPPDLAMSGVAFHPDFASNGMLYVITGEATPNPHTPHYSSPQDDTASAFDNVLYEVQVDSGNPDVVDLTSKRELLRVHQAHLLHNMNDLTFAGDGYLYISMGDGGTTREGTPSHYETNAQLTDNPFGCVLRIDIDNIGPNGRYAIPADNPFANGSGGNVPEIYAWGLRNPWRISTDRLTGLVYTAVNGDFTIEWINRVELGHNYGWAVKEGSFLWDPVTGNAMVDPAPDPSYTSPLAEYDHNGSQAFGSAIGGFVYRGTALPELQGLYLSFDWLAAVMISMDPISGALERIPIDAGGEQLVPSLEITWGEDEDGELYLGRNTGEVFKLVAASDNFVRANCNGQGDIDISDPVFLISYLFDNGPSPACEDACDVNDNGILNIADVVTALSRLFEGGPPFDPPGPSCGIDPTLDTLGCGEFNACP